MLITEDALRELTTNCCTEMLQLDLAPTNEVDGAADEFVVGTVRIVGNSCSDLQVAVPSQLSRYIAGVMFDSDAQTIDPSEISDAIGEVANIIGGSVKGLVEGESQLSLPEVTTVSRRDYDFKRSDHCVDIHFKCEGQGFLVRYTELAMAGTSA
ncbi:MAG: chemotaxis protein CheX [Planctomycetales bacterium]|nr:chemotaxis protein CheX [Planctomycetales bacterium]